MLRTREATWCGPVEHLTDGSVWAPEVYCFTSQADGYDVFRPSGDLEPFGLEIKAASVSPQLALETYYDISPRSG